MTPVLTLTTSRARRRTCVSVRKPSGLTKGSARRPAARNWATNGSMRGRSEGAPVMRKSVLRCREAASEFQPAVVRPLAQPGALSGGPEMQRDQVRLCGEGSVVDRSDCDRGSVAVV